jgi:hypothetical protein
VITSDEIKITDDPGKQVDPEATLQASGAPIGGVAAAPPGARERIGQANRGALMHMGDLHVTS